MESDNLDEVLREMKVEGLKDEQKNELRAKLLARLSAVSEVQQVGVGERGDVEISDFDENHEKIVSSGIQSSATNPGSRRQAGVESIRLSRGNQGSRVAPRYFPSNIAESDLHLGPEDMHSSVNYINMGLRGSPSRVLAQVEAARAAKNIKKPLKPQEQFILTSSVFLNTNSQFSPHDGVGVENDMGVVKGMGGEWYSKLPAKYPGYAEIAHDVRNAEIEAVIQHQLVTFCNVKEVPVNSWHKLHRTRLLCSQPPQSPQKQKKPSQKLHNSHVHDQFNSNVFTLPITSQNNWSENQHLGVEQHGVEVKKGSEIQTERVNEQKAEIQRQNGAESPLRFDQLK